MNALKHTRTRVGKGTAPAWAALLLALGAFADHRKRLGRAARPGAASPIRRKRLDLLLPRRGRGLGDRHVRHQGTPGRRSPEGRADHLQDAPGLEQPLLQWTPSIAPSGMAFYTGSIFPGWEGDLFVGALAGQHLRRLALEGERVVGQEVLLPNTLGRIQDVRQGPDGFLYLLTDARDGEVYRLEPAEQTHSPVSPPAQYGGTQHRHRRPGRLTLRSSGLYSRQRKRGAR